MGEDSKLQWFLSFHPRAPLLNSALTWAASAIALWAFSLDLKLSGGFSFRIVFWVIFALLDCLSGFGLFGCLVIWLVFERDGLFNMSPSS